MAILVKHWGLDLFVYPSQVDPVPPGLASATAPLDLSSCFESRDRSGLFDETPSELEEEKSTGTVQVSEEEQRCWWHKGCIRSWRFEDDGWRTCRGWFLHSLLWRWWLGTTDWTLASSITSVDPKSVQRWLGSEDGNQAWRWIIDVAEATLEDLRGSGWHQTFFFLPPNKGDRFT